MPDYNRRQFLSLMAAGTATPFLLTFSADKALAGLSRAAYPDKAPLPLNRTDPSAVFDLSVASGDPTASGVMLWTHIRSEQYDPNESLTFQVAVDPGFTLLALEGKVRGEQFGADRDHTVRLDLDGQLNADSYYYYRFQYRGVFSRTGRCRTAAAVGQSVDSVKFALLTCQDYTNGYYGALNCVADDNSIDYVAHLGDFIYESVGDPRYQDLPFEDRRIELPSGFPVAMNLEDYRFLHRTYRSDPFLQKAMENHTWIITTDDHETCNDCYWDYEQDTLGCPDHPYSTDPQFNNDADLKRQLKLDSQRAWAEYIPARIDIDEGRTHPHLYSRIYRQFRFGDLVNLNMLDTRTYRTPHPCGEDAFLGRYVPFGCGNLNNPEQSMMGETQREWLINTMAASTARWNMLGNQTYMGRLGIDLGEKAKLPFNVDAWDGYDAERIWLMNEVQSNSIENLVVVTGDLHTYMASQVKKNYADLNPFNFSNQIGVEFMTPSLTSAGLFDVLLAQAPDDEVRDFLLNATSEGAVRLTNPHIRMFNSKDHGYSTIEYTDGYCEWIAYKVNKNLNSGEQERKALARYRKYEAWPWMTQKSVQGY
ncbi:alkaline phosphatase D family protein [Hahella sp. NBU794]|uniref:alkaline phosphatase D family protein n=1 Tax=Hahella sp. NBU794 TaxID=3422590 RepID=UPI003D6EE2AF